MLEARVLTDKKSERNYRTILANSGEMMESGETRDLSRLYVMGRDGKLILISELNTNPDRQKDKYKVNFVANHGHVDLATGERVVDIEDVIGDARVWIDGNGKLMARVYFADDDPKADHAYAISENASYSIGTEWYPDGYYGAENEINGMVGILREISMVDTGNDPRAQTIDRKPESTEAHRSVEEEDGKNNTKERKKMPKKLDELTAEEAATLKESLDQAVDVFTAEVEPAAENKDAEEAEKATEENKEAGEEAETTAGAENKDTLHRNVVVIHDRVVRNEQPTKGLDWLHGKEGHVAFADTLKRAGRLGPAFDAMWRAEASKHMSLDGITGLPNPAPVDQYFADALEKSDGIISHFATVSTKSLRLHMETPVESGEDLARAHGHRPHGSDKVLQSLKDWSRDLLCLMVYKRLDLDALEMWENPELIDFRAKELVDAIIVEIEHAAVVGDGRTSDVGKSLFQNSRGFYSMLADSKDTDGIGKYFAGTYQNQKDDNLYDDINHARGQISTEGTQVVVTSAAKVSELMTAKSDGHYLIAPGTRPEDLLGVAKVYTPSWMDGNKDADAVLFVENSYTVIGDSGITNRTEFDTSKNVDMLLAETPRGGSLTKYHSAVVITPEASEAA